MNEQARRKAVWGSGIAISAALCSLFFAGCGDLVRQGQSTTTLVVNTLTGARGTSGNFSSILESDVRTNGGIVSDAGQVVLRLQMKDPVAGPSPINAVTLTRYRVQYLRADGRNTPGVDVPHPFDGAATGTVNVGGTIGLPFTLVRLQAKAEPPLIGLSASGTVAISTIAEVTFYGHDQTGTSVSATGHIEVVFSDFADPS
jgi:hypothetical protein